MELRIVNPDSKYPKVRLNEPTGRGYIYIAGAVKPGRLPLVPPNAKRARVLRALKELGRRLERTEGVVKVTVFRAVAIPPTARVSGYLRQRRGSVHPPRHDVLVLVETTSPGVARQVQRSPAYEAVMDALRKNTAATRVIVARNTKRIGDVDETRQGLFLFNHFVADDVGQGLELWEYLASWFTKEAGLENSVVLQPLEDERSEYSFINEVRLSSSLPKYVWQLTKKSFRSFVLANLDANRVGAMPAFYRLA